MAFTPDVQVLIDSVDKLSDAQKLAFNEVIFTESTQGSSITRYHNIIAGVTPNTPIPFGDRGEDWDYMKDASGLASNCDDVPCDVGIELSTKKWNPNLFKCTSEYCVQDLDYKMKDFFNSERWLDGSDEGTFYAAFLRDLITQRIVNSHWTKAYFTATTATSTALTGIDGLFVQYAALAPVGSSQRIEIPANAGADYASQAALPATAGYDTFNAMYEAFEASRTLRSRRDCVIKTTRALAYNYVKQLRADNQLNCCERDTTTAIYSIDNLNIYGMKIEVVDEWDYIIQAEKAGVPVFPELNNGTAYTAPHRAVLTYKDNEPIGTGDAARLNDLTVKYDDYSEKTKTVAKYTFDVKVLRDTDFILAM